MNKIPDKNELKHKNIFLNDGIKGLKHISWWKSLKCLDSKWSESKQENMNMVKSFCASALLFSIWPHVVRLFCSAFLLYITWANFLVSPKNNSLCRHQRSRLQWRSLPLSMLKTHSSARGGFATNTNIRGRRVTASAGEGLAPRSSFSLMRLKYEW